MMIPYQCTLDGADLEGDGVDPPADSSAGPRPRPPRPPEAPTGTGRAAKGAGKSRVQTPPTTSVATPPMTTDGTTPHQAAVTPDSNSPSSFEAPMKTEFTALTRPRIASGVSS